MFGLFLAIYENALKFSFKSIMHPSVKTVLVCGLVFQFLFVYPVALSAQSAIGQIEIVVTAKPHFSLSQVNSCNASVGHNEFCINIFEGTIQPMDHNSIVTGSGTGILFTNATQVSEFEQSNNCDVKREGDSLADCENRIEAFNTQSSTTNLANDGGYFNLSNMVSSKQFVNQQNDCDESGDDSSDLSCSNLGGKRIHSTSQSNIASGSSTADQSNKALYLQSSIQQNDCDKSGVGNNTVFCKNDISHLISESSQSNIASGSSTADQSNKALYLQSSIQQNDCDKSGVGNNTVFCFNAAGSVIFGVSQSNAASSGSATVNQINKALYSQHINQRNDCDVLKDSSNTVDCYNSGGTRISDTSQSNIASGFSTADQSNKASLYQIASQNNDCDESADSGIYAVCDNKSTSSISPISHSNAASSGSATVNQVNEASLSQVTNQLNDCDVSEGDINTLFCT